jgi:hypothetical protein
MGRGRRRAGPTTEKTAHNNFFYFKSFFQLNKSVGENKNRRNTWGPQENVKFCMEIDLNICYMRITVGRETLDT